MEITTEMIARQCHEANRAWCENCGDKSQKTCDEATPEQRESCIKGVEFRLANLSAPASAQHEAWMVDKLDKGWKYGKTKSEAKKTHPCLVPFSELPFEQKVKDGIFSATVKTFAAIRASQVTVNTTKP